MDFNDLEHYQKHFQRLIQLERDEEMQWHFNEINTLSPQERQAKGRAVLGLQLKSSSRGLGGSYVMKFGSHRQLPDHRLSVGDLVIVSRGKPGRKDPQATVTEKNPFSLTLSFSGKPDKWLYSSSVRIDLFANDITFQRMLGALQQLHKRRLLKNLVLGQAGPQFVPSEKTSQTPEFANPNLNNSQKEAVEKSLQAQEVFLIHGPPGTGKTTTLVESVVQHVKLGKQVLAAADSNVAVDNLVEKIAATGIIVVRVGNPARVTKSVIEHTLDYLLLNNTHFQDAQEMWQQADKLRDEQKGYRKPHGQGRRGLSDEEIRHLAARGGNSRGISSNMMREMANWLYMQDEVKHLQRKARELNNRAIKDVLQTAQVICATNSTAGSETLQEFLFHSKTKFDVIFIDEATQAMEPACLIPMVLGDKYVMAGDHKQLPPTVLNRQAEKYLTHTLFERLLRIYGKDIMSLLKVQYRMNKQIMAFSNREFYEGELLAHESVAEHTLESLEWHVYLPMSDAIAEVLEPTKPIIFADTVKLPEPWEQKHEGSSSTCNPTEAEFVNFFVERLLESGLQPAAIGVISPYNDQVKLLQEQLQHYEGLEVKSIDGFQGREKEVIIISFVRANKDGEIGFLNDLRRLNVAVTRAKRKLVMIGHSPTLRTHKLYERLIEEVEVVELKVLPEY